jgi:hypothetical protein
LAQYGGGYLVAISASQFVFFNLGGVTPNIAIDFLVVGGGSGGAGDSRGGGGGAGGLRCSTGSASSGGGGTLESAVLISKSTDFLVTVGAGGLGQTAAGTRGIHRRRFRWRFR